MSFSLNSKSPATIRTPDNDILVFVNDFLKYEVEQIKLYTEKVSAGSGDDKLLFSGVNIPANYRVLMWVRTHPTEAINPVRYVPMLKTKDGTGNEVIPIYEAINPTVHSLDLSGGGFLTFWTNFTEYVSEYNVDKVLKFKHDNMNQALSVGQSVYRALCGCVIKFRRVYVTGGVISSNLGASPTDVNDDDKLTYELVPICEFPIIMQMFLSDYPIIDFNSGTGSLSANGLRRHTHSAADPYDAGFAFAVYHPGTLVPQKPWEAV